MEFNQEVKQATDPIYKKISKVMPEIEWSVHAPYIHKINKLKKEIKKSKQGKPKKLKLSTYKQHLRKP